MRLHVLVRAAAARGRKMLDKYYSKTDDSIMYRLAMSKLVLSPGSSFFSLHLVLHPRYKTKYFEIERWEREWIQTAKDLLSEQWDNVYKDTSTEMDTTRKVSYLNFSIVIEP